VLRSSAALAAGATVLITVLLPAYPACPTNPPQAVIVMAEVTKPPPPKARGTRRTLAHRRLVVRGCDTLQPIGSSYQGTS
jgi:hypothetical protein